MYSALFAAGVLLLTTALPVTIHDDAELRHLHFGRPLWYVTQDQSWRNPPFPYAAHLGWVAESATHIDLVRTAFDFVAWYGVVELVTKLFFHEK